jgi:hypothetical protein
MPSTISSDELAVRQLVEQSMKLPPEAQALLHMAVDQACDNLTRAAIKKLTNLSPAELSSMAQEVGLSEGECQEAIASLRKKFGDGNG